MRMIQNLNFADDALAERALTIQKRAYRIEADLIGFEGIPQLHESVTDLRASEETFIGYWLDQTLVGMLGYEQADTTLTIARLVVDPDYFRRGVGQALVAFVETIPAIHTWIVSTGAANTPARRFYERLGYTLHQEWTLPQGLLMATYHKNA